MSVCLHATNKPQQSSIGSRLTITSLEAIFSKQNVWKLLRVVWPTLFVDLRNWSWLYRVMLLSLWHFPLLSLSLPPLLSCTVQTFFSLKHPDIHDRIFCISPASPWPGLTPAETDIFICSIICSVTNGHSLFFPLCFCSWTTLGNCWPRKSSVIAP